MLGLCASSEPACSMITNANNKTPSKRGLFMETPDAELDVIDGGFGTKPALGLKELRYLSVAHRGWKLKHAPIPCLDAVLLESSSFCDIDAGFFLGTNDVPHPDPQPRLFIWARRGVSAGKGNNGFLSHGLPSAMAAD